MFSVLPAGNVPAYSVEDNGRIYWSSDWARLWDAIDSGALKVQRVFHGPQAFGDTSLYVTTV